MTLRITSDEHRITFKAPINVVCFMLGIAANKALKDDDEEKFGREQRKELVKSLRQAKSNFRGLILAEINTENGKRITITL